MSTAARPARVRPAVAAQSDATESRSGRKPFLPGLVPPPGALLDWRDPEHFDHRRTKPCALCGGPTPLRSHAGEAAHKVCAEAWIAANPVEARAFGRFASDAQPKSSGPGDHA
ncbi:hypothetical protein [Streptomyces sp. NPDC101237]|uniref:hypothetical protein n=1 Tax=Streptomyces sp. NPDC101237 TaxID=3366139 RepID=UPI00382EAF13